MNGTNNKIGDMLKTIKTFNSVDIDEMIYKLKNESNLRFIKDYLQDSETIIKQISITDIDKMISLFFDAWLRGSTVFVMGNGGSASTASHFAADLNKYTIYSATNGQKKNRFRVICLTDNPILISAWTNDNGFDTIFEQQLEPWIKKDDVIVAFSVHGGSLRPGGGKWSQNIPKACDIAKARGAKIVGFSGDTGGSLKQVADACIVIPTARKETITPHVEGLHVVIHHLIIHRLKQLIQEWGR